MHSYTDPGHKISHTSPHKYVSVNRRKGSQLSTEICYVGMQNTWESFLSGDLTWFKSLANSALYNIKLTIFKTLKHFSHHSIFKCHKKVTHLGFQLVVKLRVIEFDKAKEECSFVCNCVVLWNLFLHVLFQEGHVAQEATSEGSQQLEEQLDLRVVTSVKQQSSRSTTEYELL